MVAAVRTGGSHTNIRSIMASIQSVCVYCGSSPGSDPLFVEEARRLGAILADHSVRLVYGGGGNGLMGELARATFSNGGSVTGIIPSFLMTPERALSHGAEMVVVKDMHERKRLMFEHADAFVALPGGVGTLEELVEQLTWAQLGHHQKPMLVVNTAGFWDPFLTLIDHMRANAFIHTPAACRLLVAESVDEVLPMLQAAAAAIPEETLHKAGSAIIKERM